MRQSWLFLSFAYALMIYTSTWYTSLAICVVAMVFHMRKFSKGHIAFLCFLLLGVLRIQPQPMETPTSKILYIKEIKSKYALAQSDDQTVLVYGLEGVSLHDVIEVKGEYERIDGVNNSVHQGFYFPTWCERRNMYYGIQVKEYTLIEEGSDAPHDVYTAIQNLDEQKRVFANTMIYGIHEEEEPYLVTSSGMHIASFYRGVRLLLSLFLENRVLSFLCFVGMGMHAYLTVFSPTMLRLLTFQLISFLCPQMDRKDQLGCSMYLLLFIAPYMLYELSFLIPVGFRLVSLFSLHKVSKRWISFLVLVPIQFLCMQSVDWVGLWLFPILRYAYAWLYAATLLTIFMPCSITWLCTWKAFLEQCTSFQMITYYAASLPWFFLWWHLVFQYIANKQRKVLIKLLALLLFTQVSVYIDPFAQVYMMDVGQGDCTLIVLPFHQGVIMIDAMGSKYKDIPKDIILPVLKQKQIKKIDALIVTHDDYDHSGGVSGLQELIPIDTIITKKQGDIEVQGTPIHFLNTTYVGDDINDDSIITYFELYDMGFLFMGDAGYGAEQHLMNTYANLKVDVLKAGHHGSNTSSSEAFLHQYQPKLALVSAGRNNRYGHPHVEVLKTMEKEGTYPLVTSQKGAVSIRFCKFFRFFKTADNEFGIIE